MKCIIGHFSLFCSIFRWTEQHLKFLVMHIKHHYDICTALSFPLLFILKEKHGFCYAFLFQQEKS